MTTILNPEEQARIHGEEWATRLRSRECPVTSAFVRSDDAKSPPALARILRRGGEVRLKLFLSLMWISASKPHDSQYPTRAWAELLALADPDNLGRRRIEDALNWLEREGFVRCVSEPPQARRTLLLDETGSGEDYALPYLKKRRYMGLPSTFWSNGWMPALSGVGLAILLILLDRAKYVGKVPSTEPIWIAPSIAREQYHLSEDSWTRGTKELRQLGIITVQRIGISRSFGYKRVRNAYRINFGRFNGLPIESIPIELGE